MSENINVNEIEMQTTDQTGTPVELVREVTKFSINKTTFNHVVSQINTLVDEATFEVTSEGLKFRSMDPSHIALIDVEMPNCMFERFEVSGTENKKFGVRLDELVKVLKNFDKNEILNMELDERSMLQISGENFNTALRLIESGASSTPLPKINFNANIELDTNTIKKIKNIQAVSEYVIFEYNTRNFNIPSNFSAEGKGDRGEAKLNIPLDNGTVTDNSKESSKATYSLNYLTKFFAKIITDVKGTVKLEYSTKMPLRIEYPIVQPYNKYQNNEGLGRISFYLAPRVSD